MGETWFERWFPSADNWTWRQKAGFCVALLIGFALADFLIWVTFG